MRSAQLLRPAQFVNGYVDAPYDSSRKITWKYGNRAGHSPSGSVSGALTWGAVRDVGSEVGNIFIAGLEWTVARGVKTIKALRGRVALFGPNDVSQMAVDIYRLDPTVYTLVGTSGLFVPNRVHANGSDTLVLDSADGDFEPFDVELEEGERYFFCVRAVKASTATTVPYVGGTSLDDTAEPCIVIGVDAAAWNGSTIDRTNSDRTQVDYEIRWHNAALELEYESASLCEVERDIDLDASDTKVHWYAYPVGENWVLKLEQVRVDDGEAVTFKIADGSENSSENLRNTITVDMGNGAAGVNELTNNGATVSLPDIGGNGQEGRYLDLILLVRGDTVSAGHNLFYQNRELEPGIHCHSSKANASRGNTDDYSFFRGFLRIDPIVGTGTSGIGKMVCSVADATLVMCGDSYAIQGSGTSLRSLNTDRWGGLPKEFTQERGHILYGESGEQIAHLAAANMWANATPGDGDASELIGYGLEWCFCVSALNDVNAHNPNSEPEAREAAIHIMEDYQTMISDIVAGGDKGFVLGAPSYSHPAAANQYERSALRRLGHSLLGLCATIGWPFHNVWMDTVDPTTADTDMPAFIPAYTDDDGTHINAVAGAYIRPRIVKTVEQGLIDARQTVN